MVMSLIVFDFKNNLTCEPIWIDPFEMHATHLNVCTNTLTVVINNAWYTKVRERRAIVCEWHMKYCDQKKYRHCYVLVGPPTLFLYFCYFGFVTSYSHSFEVGMFYFDNSWCWNFNHCYTLLSIRKRHWSWLPTKINQHISMFFKKYIRKTRFAHYYTNIGWSMLLMLCLCLHSLVLIVGINLQF